MGYSSTHAANRMTADAVVVGWFSGRSTPPLRACASGRQTTVVVEVVRWEILDAGPGDVRRFEDWKSCASAIWGLRSRPQAGSREWAVYGVDAAGVRRALMAWRKPFRGDELFVNKPQGSLAIGELPVGKFNKKLGCFAAVRVWNVTT